MAFTTVTSESLFDAGNVIKVCYRDGDCTICQIIGENSSGTGVRCEVLEVLGRGKTRFEVGQKRTFRYEHNPAREITLLQQATPTKEICDCEECETETNLFNLPKDKPMLRELTQTLKRVLSPELQAMFKAGFIGTDLELTGRGTQELVQIMFAKFQTELAERAKEVVAELEKESK